MAASQSLNTERQISDLFDQYCDLFNRGLRGTVDDLTAMADFFADSFIGASPAGVKCCNNDIEFQKAMQAGYAFYRGIGVISMQITSKEVTSLDAFHTMIKVGWRSNFVSKSGKKSGLDFQNIYFTQLKDNRHRIFAYITGDEQGALKEAGLI
jgi:hypothetical protein